MLPALDGAVTIEGLLVPPDGPALDFDHATPTAGCQVAIAMDAPEHLLAIVRQQVIAAAYLPQLVLTLSHRPQSSLAPLRRAIHRSDDPRAHAARQSDDPDRRLW